MKYLLYVLLAFVLWYVMFVLKPFNFWISMAFSTSLLSAISLYYNREQLAAKYWNLKEIMIGVVSALVLYGIFFVGKMILDSINIIPDHNQNISNVYANREIFPSWVVGLMLFFPIGFGEEIFWRGYLQRILQSKYSKIAALALTVFFYTAVHIPTLNPVLMLASFVVGIYWGLIFMWRGNIVAALLSHMIWDPLIFVIAPIN
jgi:uncharacterized protein